MQLLDNWRQVLRHSWSIKFLILAGLLSFMEMLFPIFPLFMGADTVQIISTLLTAAAFVARLLAQKPLTAAPPSDAAILTTEQALLQWIEAMPRIQEAPLVIAHTADNDGGYTR